MRFVLGVAAFRATIYVLEPLLSMLFLGASEFSLESWLNPFIRTQRRARK